VQAIPSIFIIEHGSNWRPAGSIEEKHALYCMGSREIGLPHQFDDGIAPAAEAGERIEFSQLLVTPSVGLLISALSMGEAVDSSLLVGVVLTASGRPSRRCASRDRGSKGRCSFWWGDERADKGKVR
jgi:hypothetical protein